MEKWREAWRAGYPTMPDAGLEALADAMRRNSPDLIQHGTTVPPPLLAVAGWPVEQACPVAYVHWKGDGKATVEDVDSAFATTCVTMSMILDEPGGCRHFTNWWDETDREGAIALLLPEIELELSRRRDLYSSPASCYKGDTDDESVPP